MIGIIYIRTDANDILATGHVMRCLTIADAFKERKQKVIFIVSDIQSEKLIANAGYDIINLNVDWNKLEIKREYDILIKVLMQQDVLLIDTYSVTESYVRKMRKLCKVVIIDDLFKEKYSADIIINYNLYYYLFEYDERYKDTHTILLLGGDYVPLRKQFRLCNIIKRDNIDSMSPKILLICGGGDLHNTMNDILLYINENNRELFKRITWYVIVGAYNTHYKELKNISLRYDNIELYRNVKNMAQIMSECDICISAASTVLYECSAMLLPTIYYCVADNQKYDICAFQDKMIYAGNFVDDVTYTLSNIEKGLNELIVNKEKYRDCVNKLKELIDKDGVYNLVDAILNYK